MASVVLPAVATEVVPAIGVCAGEAAITTSAEVGVGTAVGVGTTAGVGTAAAGVEAATGVGTAAGVGAAACVGIAAALVAVPVAIVGGILLAVELNSKAGKVLHVSYLQLKSD